MSTEHDVSCAFFSSTYALGSNGSGTRSQIVVENLLVIFEMPSVLFLTRIPFTKLKIAYPFVKNKYWRKKLNRFRVQHL